MVSVWSKVQDLHMAQLKPLPLTVSCFSKIQIGFSILVLAHPGSPGQRAIKRVSACVCVYIMKLLAKKCIMPSKSFTGLAGVCSG